MDDDLALIISATCIKAARDIGDLARLIPADRKDLKVAIASAVHEIHASVIDPLFSENPALREGMARRLSQYDRYI
ncbi:hypothetical protein HHL08_08200 [Sphingobium sp. AR-3-1]|uniref:Uncharacterized protein n=1 Tax=Sphingobium psychrophilum TaxID=2728834 RepID=A0A7X9ZT22_9SPHN|nr:hypothetical protein [Sphingobium psychrophilum]NML10136.1 hypothetical protein [Sphingobium psychrophilum]